MMRFIDGHCFFGPVIGLIVDNRIDARRLISHLITRGDSFAANEKEGEFCIALELDYDLDRLRRKLPGLKFEVWS